MDHLHSQNPYFHGSSQLIEDLHIRQSRKTLQVFRQIETQNTPFLNEKPKKICTLQSIKEEIRLENIRSMFMAKISKNNIFQEPKFQQFVSQKLKDQIKCITWKGFHIKYQKYILSIFYMTEMIFLIQVYILSSFMSCIPSFVEAEQYRSLIALSIILISLVLCFLKMIIFSVLKKVHQGIMLEYIEDILISYVKKCTFYVDFVYLILSCSLLVEMIRANDVERIQRLSSYLLLCTMLRIFCSIDNLITFRNTFITGFKMDQFYKLLKLTVFNWVLGHFVAVMLLAMVYINKQQNWLVAKNIYHEPWYVQYNWAFYWSATMMTTVGFGDYTATTHQQARVVAYLQLFSCIVLAYNISQIGNIIYAIRLADQHYLGKVAAFKRLAERNQTNSQLKMKIQSYLKQEKEIKERFEYHQQAEVINSLPESLRKDFILESTNKIFRTVPFFRSLHKNASIELGQAFISSIEYPGEVLVRANHYNQNIIILRQGKVGLTYNKHRSILNGTIVQEISQKRIQSIFGLKKHQFIDPFLLTVQFLSPGKVINYDITIMEYSFVYKIKIEKLIKIIKSNQIDLEYFFSIVHCHHAYEREWFQLKCQRCSNLPNKKHEIEQSSIKTYKRLLQKQSYHDKFNCPKLHYFPWSKSIILKYIKKPGQTQQGSKIYKRKKQKSQNCLILRKKIFNKYQSKRFINEKKRYEMIVKKSQIKNLFKLKSLKSKRLSGFSVSRKNFFQSYQDPFLHKKSISTKDINKKINYTEESNIQFSDPYIQQQQFGIFEEFYQDEDIKTMIDDVIKTTFDQITPKNINLTFWNLQIDLLFNYRNYFPHSNSALLDNFSLCQYDKLQKKRALTSVRRILQNYQFKNLIQFKNNENQDLLGLQNFKSMKQLCFEPPKFNKLQFEGVNSFDESDFNQIKSQQKRRFSNLSNVRFKVKIDEFLEDDSQEKPSSQIRE